MLSPGESVTVEAKEFPGFIFIDFNNNGTSRNGFTYTYEDIKRDNLLGFALAGFSYSKDNPASEPSNNGNNQDNQPDNQTPPSAGNSNQGEATPPAPPTTNDGTNTENPPINNGSGNTITPPATGNNGTTSPTPITPAPQAPDLSPVRAQILAQIDQFNLTDEQKGDLAVLISFAETAEDLDKVKAQFAKLTKPATSATEATKAKTESKNTLPQTGEASSLALTGLGLVATLASLGLVHRRQIN
ncbi:LPXTG cell wall anchor domain-containing protein [Streptococcus sp. E24BD]|uniref:LPXTG cell wall anchor domain-containing protein n=1 Tax=Streptococcus sp. E24BD TaxID=3278715 RepID=UPI00359E5F03